MIIKNEDSEDTTNSNKNLQRSWMNSNKNLPYQSKNEVKKVNVTSLNFEFYFNFPQMRVIYKVGKKFNLKKFFSKMLDLNLKKASINIDKSYFTVFSDFMFDYFDKQKKNFITPENDATLFTIGIK